MKFLKVLSRSFLVLVLISAFVQLSVAGTTRQEVLRVENLVIQNAYKAYQLGYNHGDNTVCQRLLTIAQQQKAQQLAAGRTQAAKFVYYVYAGLCYNACLDGVDAKNQHRDIWSIDYQLIKNDMYKWGCTNYGVCDK